MTPPRSAPRARRIVRAVAAAAALVAIAGCSWRLETPPPEWPSPDAVTQMRDRAAEREQAVIDAIAASPGAGTPLTVVLGEIEGAAAPERLETLGGLYVPYPDSSTPPAASAVPTDVPGAVAVARDGHLADALVAEDADLAAILAAAGLSHAVSAWYAVWVDATYAGDEAIVVAERTLASPALPESGPVPESTGIDVATVGSLAVAHDEARYAYEVLAAAAPSDPSAERDTWLARRDLHDARGAALAALPGVEDERAAVYLLPDGADDDPDTRLSTAVAVETDLAETYAALLVDAPSADLPWLLDAAFDAYAQAAAYRGPDADVAPVPALPGLMADEG